MRLTKHHGLGNDFLVVLDENNSGPLDVGSDVARRLCDRRLGIGADGLIHGADEDGIVRMHLFNADGSRAEMSGNGIRCLAQAVALARGVDELSTVILTDAGDRRVRVRRPFPGGHEVRSEMGRIAPGPTVPGAVEERLEGARYVTLDVGNPHLVIWTDALDSRRSTEEGSWLERQFPEGLNVEYASTGADGTEIDMQVWERGVGLTEACGTGACAVAAAARQWSEAGDEVTVRMPGGEAHVRLVGDEAVLDGPVHFIGTVEVPDG